MIEPACPISIDVYEFAAQAIAFLAFLAIFGAFFIFGAKGADWRLMDCIHVCERSSTRASSVDIGYKLPCLGLVEFLWELRVASFAYSEIADVVIINSVVAYCSTHPTHITYKVQISDPLKVIGVADRAAVLCTRRHSAYHTVDLIANSTEWATQPGLRAANALWLQHFLVSSSVELKLMTFEALVLKL